MTFAFLNDGLFQAVAACAITVATPFVVQSLRAHAKLANTLASKAMTEKRVALLERLEAYLFQQASNVAAVLLPQIAAKVGAGQLNTPGAFNGEMKSIGDSIKKSAIEQFKAREGVQLETELGSEAINSHVSAIVGSLVQSLNVNAPQS